MDLGAGLYSSRMPLELEYNMIDDNEDGLIDNAYGLDYSENRPISKISRNSGILVGLYIVKTGEQTLPANIIKLVSRSGERVVVIPNSSLRKSVAAELQRNPLIDTYTRQKIEVSAQDL